MNFWPLETWRKNLRKISMENYDIFFWPRKSIGKPLLSNVVWWEKDFFQGISVWKKNHHRESEFQMWKMTMADAMKKILNNQVLIFFPHGKKQCFQIWSIVHPNLCPARFFFSTIVGVEKVQAGWKNYCLLQASYSSTSGPLPRQQL